MNRQEEAETALKHTEEMANKYAKEIKYSSENSVIFRGLPKTSFFQENSENGEKILVDQIYSPKDSIATLFSEEIQNEIKKGKKVAILNFGNFKNAGGNFLKGLPTTQEELLCYDSFLYNVLKEHNTDYYIPNQRNTNKCLYRNVGIYSKDIYFFSKGQITKADVITCSLPNYSAIKKHFFSTSFQNYTTLIQRIKFVKYICKKMNVNILIIGFFGCEKYAQKPLPIEGIFLKTFSYKEKDGIEKIYYSCLKFKDPYHNNIIKEDLEDWMKGALKIET